MYCPTGNIFVQRVVMTFGSLAWIYGYEELSFQKKKIFKKYACLLIHFDLRSSKYFLLIKMILHLKENIINSSRQIVNKVFYWLVKFLGSLIISKLICTYSLKNLLNNRKMCQIQNKKHTHNKKEKKGGMGIKTFCMVFQCNTMSSPQFKFSKIQL